MALFVGVGVAQDAVPAYFTVEESAVVVEGYQYAHRCADDVVLRYEAPEAGVLGVIAVVAHHEVIVHAEGIVGCGLSVDYHAFSVDPAGVGVVFVVAYDASVDFPVFGSEGYCQSAGGYEESVVAAVVGEGPAVGYSCREQVDVGHGIVAYGGRHRAVGAQGVEYGCSGGYVKLVQAGGRCACGV